MALIQGIVDTQKQNLKSLGIVNSGDDLTIELEVKQNGVNIEFVNPIFELLATKSDGTRVRQLVDITYIGNVVNIIGDEQLVTSPGIVTLQLIIKDNKRSSTCLFYFMCGTSLDRDIIQSISKVEVLNQLDEYVVQAFANLKEYEQRIIASDASIRNLNEDMIKAEKVRVQAEINRGNTFDNLVLKMNNAINAAIATDETLQNNEIKRIDNYNTLKAELESIKDDLILLNNNISKEEEKRVQAEIDRVNKALEIIEKLKSTNDKVTIAEAERVTEFNNIKSELTSLKEALTTINNIANSNEEIRKTNESGRVAAEQQRVTDFEKIKSDNTSLGVALTKKVDDKIVEIEANNNTFKQGINEQYDNIVRENETFKSEVNAKTGNCEEGYFDGKVYPTLKDRLDFDFEDVNRRLLEAELLGYEGSIMKCDSTYSGLTSDLEIKGRTLQNLLLDNTFENTTTVDGGWKATRLNIAFDLKANTDYLLIYTVSKNSNNYSLNIGGKIDNAFSVMGLDSSIGTHKVIIKTYSDITDKKMNKLFFQYLNTIAGEIKVTNIMLLEYSINLESLPIEYFEGIKSVGEQEKIGDKYKVGIKSYGKNLLDIEKFKNVENHNNVPKTELATFNKCFLIKNTKPNTKYTICRTSSAVGTVNVSILNSDGSRASLTSGTSTNRTIETSSDGLLYIAIQSVTQERITTALSESGELWLEEGAIPTPYEPYQSDTKYLLVDEPLRSLLNGVSDTIDELGVETKRVGKIILDGSENWGFSVEQENTIRFYISNRTGKTSFGYCDTLTYRASGMPHGDYEYILINPTNIFINIAKSKLTTQDVEGVKNWLQTNNTTLIYELAEPIVINHNKNLNLKTYEGTTYISSENTLKANISCKVPSNVQAVLQDTRARNRELENELETTTLKLKEADNILKEMDTDLIKTNWEMDDRLFEVEWALEDAGLVTSVSTFNINNKMRGSASVMALSKFEQAKIIIMSGDYDRATLEGQLSKYLKRNIIAQDEYDTLISMMDAKEIVVGE
ncbi:MAG: hypothetical protein E7D69_04235 [Clostridium celatum]|nr:hypothetical protein [Clostridium celatum]